MAHKDVLLLFDVDGTLTAPRLPATAEMKALLQRLRKDYTIGLVGGSDLKKQEEQLGAGVLADFDYVFSENGLHAFHQGKEIHRQSFTRYLGDKNIKRLAQAVLGNLAKYSDDELPVMRGTFFELRNGMVNVSPIGRNCSQSERDAFEKHDHQVGLRAKLIKALDAEFNGPASGLPGKLRFSIGGQISFDVFPEGWDKTYCLQFVREAFREIHFFGDKTMPGGNDFEIYTAAGVKGHSVKSFQETMQQLEALFGAGPAAAAAAAGGAPSPAAGSHAAH